MGLMDMFKKKGRDEEHDNSTENLNVDTNVNVSGSLNLTKGTSLNLTKGNTVSLDFTKSKGFDKPLTNLELGCGWDTRCDLDIYCNIKSSCGGNKVVYFGDKRYQGVRLNHDNLTGDGDGDDEIIFINLDNLENDIVQLDLYVNIYTSGKTFGDVKGAYSVLRDMNNKVDLCKTNLTSREGTNCLYVASLNKVDGVWYYTVKDEAFNYNGSFNRYLTLMCEILPSSKVGDR